MALPDFSIRRPVTIFMIFISIILLGIISWDRLPQELFPPITYPQLTVVTTYKDAAPEEIEILVTKPLEETIGTVSGLKRISSISKEETSLITAEFNWGTNMDFAALGVREKIDLIKERLPRGCEEPVVVKYNPFDLPVIVLNITSKLPPTELMQFTRKVIKNELEKTEGVAVVQLSGGREREILVEVDQGRLQAAGISVVAVAESLNKTNLNYPAGTIEESFYEYLIRTIGEFKAVKEIREIPVAVDEKQLNPREENPQEQGIKPPQEKSIEKRLILLKDIAVVKDTLQDQVSISRYNGNDTISLSVIKQAGANTIKTADNVKRTIEELSSSMPKDVKMKVTYDQSQFIKGAITGVSDAAIQGGFLAFLVLFIFLRRFFSSLIVTLTIPISILAVFSMMYFSNISLNMISLGGLALGVGMLVDCAIVVIDNIFRHRQAGESAKDASVSGTNEVNSAIWGSTLTTVVVFLPMIFVVGIAGQLFKELAFTVIASLMVSLVTAVTLIPILVSKESMGKTGNLKNKFIEKCRPVLAAISRNSVITRLKPIFSVSRISRGYQSALEYFIKRRFMCLSAAFLIFLASIFMLTKTDWELLPRVDQGQFVIKLNMSPGTRLAVTSSVVKKIEQQLLALPEINEVTVTIGSSREKTSSSQNVETLGSHQANIIVSLKPLEMYKRTKYTTLQALLKGFSANDPSKYRVRASADILQDLKGRLEKENLLGAEIEYILQESIFQAALAASAPVVIEVKGQDLDKLKKLSEEVAAGLSKIKGVYSIRSSLVKPAPEAKVYVRKDKAAVYNLSVSDIALTAQTAMKGYVATKYKEGGREVDVRVRLRPQDRTDMNKVRRLVVHSPLDIDVPLAEVTYMSVGKGPSQIQRLNQQRVIVISANIYKRALKDVTEDANALLGRIKKKAPADYSVKLTGENLQMRESFQSLQFALILSLVLVYMVMASEFESLWQPFIILFTFPLCIVGVALGLWMTHTSLSIMVILGVIVLGGIVVDNGIVLVEYVNILRNRDKMNLYDALIKASHTRLRPIMMTAFATSLGLFPLAVGLSEGAEIQIPMAVTVMSGLLFSTFLSLVIIPAIYISFENFLARVKNVMRSPIAFFKNLKKKPAVQEKDAEILPTPVEPETTSLTIKNVLRLPDKPLPALPSAPIILTGQVEPEQPKEPVKHDKYETMELLDRQRQLLLHLAVHKRVTRQEYMEKFGVSIATAARDLSVLIKKGLIKPKGPKATGRYYELT